MVLATSAVMVQSGDAVINHNKFAYLASFLNLNAPTNAILRLC